LDSPVPRVFGSSRSHSPPCDLCDSSDPKKVCPFARRPPFVLFFFFGNLEVARLTLSFSFSLFYGGRLRFSPPAPKHPASRLERRACVFENVTGQLLTVPSCFGKMSSSRSCSATPLAQLRLFRGKSLVPSHWTVFATVSFITFPPLNLPLSLSSTSLAPLALSITPKSIPLSISFTRSCHQIGPYSTPTVFSSSLRSRRFISPFRSSLSTPVV